MLTFNWCLTEWQSPFRDRTRVSSSTMEQAWVPAQHTQRPFSTYTHYHTEGITVKHRLELFHIVQIIPGSFLMHLLGRTFQHKEGYEDKTAVQTHLAVEHWLDHLCVLTGEHRAGQAEDHTHCRQQHEQWHLWRDAEAMLNLERVIKTVCNQARRTDDVKGHRNRFHCLYYKEDKTVSGKVKKENILNVCSKAACYFFNIIKLKLTLW